MGSLTVFWQIICQRNQEFFEKRFNHRLLVSTGIWGKGGDFYHGDPGGSGKTKAISAANASLQLRRHGHGQTSKFQPPSTRETSSLKLQASISPIASCCRRSVSSGESSPRAARCRTSPRARNVWRGEPTARCQRRPARAADFAGLLRHRIHPPGKLERDENCSASGRWPGCRPCR